MENKQRIYQEEQLHIYYVVAEIALEIRYPSQVKIDTVLYNFKRFQVEEVPAGMPVISFDLFLNNVQLQQEHFKLLSDISIVWGDNFKFYESEQQYLTHIEGFQANQSASWKMLSNKNFSQSAIYTDGSIEAGNTALSWLLMVAFGQSILRFNTALIHASVVKKEDRAVAFLGKSGTGKSTHSKLWLQYIPGYELLNDDNPAIKCLPNGDVYIYGTPWSGKTPCYKNEKGRLEAFIRLKQAPYNQMDLKTGKLALMALLPSFTALRWNNELFSSMIGLLENIIAKVYVGELACLPNEEAAKLCNKEIMNNKSYNYE